MSFRTTLLSFLLVLIVAMVALQWWYFRSLSEDVEKGIGQVAFDVGLSTANTVLQSFPQTVPAERLPRSPLELKLRSQGSDHVMTLEVDGREQEVLIPTTAIEKSLATLKKTMLGALFGTFALGLVASVMIAFRVTRPLNSLVQYTNRVGAGEWGIQIPAVGFGDKHELTQVVEAFNKMSLRLTELEEKEIQRRERQHLSELGEVAQGLAHTLRNPLHTLGLAIEQLGESRATPQQRQQHVLLSKRQIKRIDQWVRSFMTLVAHGVETQQDIRLNTLVGEVVNDVQTSCRPSPRLTLIMPEQIIPVHGVEAELRTIIQSVVNNAFEACSADDEIIIEVENNDEDASVTIVVSDTGCGIDSEIKGKLFSPHVTNKPYGSGMGLFFARRLAAIRYSGDIVLQDNDPKGTMAVISLNACREIGG